MSREPEQDQGATEKMQPQEPGPSRDATMLRVWEAWARKEGNEGAAKLFARVASRLDRLECAVAHHGEGLDDQTLAWMDAHAVKCRVPFSEMTPDEARKVTAFAAMWFVPALNEVHRLRAVMHPERAPVPAVDPVSEAPAQRTDSWSTPNADPDPTMMRVAARPHPERDDDR
jgi:hypothetical protein